MACDPEVVGRHILINLNPSGIASSGHNIPRNINAMPSFFFYCSLFGIKSWIWNLAIRGSTLLTIKQTDICLRNQLISYRGVGSVLIVQNFKNIFERKCFFQRKCQTLLPLSTPLKCGCIWFLEYYWIFFLLLFNK
jgi:hypothetical protein